MIGGLGIMGVSDAAMEGNRAGVQTVRERCGRVEREGQRVV